MRRLATTASRWTAAACLVLGLLLATRVPAAPSAVEALLEASLVALALFAGVKMWLHNCFESHLAAALVCAATAGGVLLAATAGPPGRGTSPVTPAEVVLLALAVAVPLLLERDARTRRAHAAGGCRRVSGQVAVVVQQA